MVDTDRDLIESIRAGDTQRYAEIVTKYEKQVYSLALRMTGNHDDAREVSQTAFVNAYRHLDRFDTDRRFFSWLYRIAHNAALDLIQHRQRHAELPEQLVATDGGPVERLAAGERAALIEAALLRLTLDYRLVVVLRHFLDLTYADIADVLGIADKTVKSRLFTARRQLADLLEEADGS
jgi:RNA polymerase sigma-70 factor (ECF subfamily)